MRRQVRLIRGVVVVVSAVALALGAPSACSDSVAPPKTTSPISEAGPLETGPEIDAESSAGAAGAAGAMSQAEGGAPAPSAVRLGIMPAADASDAGIGDETFSELSVLAAGSRARSLVARLDELLDDSGLPVESVLADLAAKVALHRAHGSSVLFSIAVVDRTEDARPVALRSAWDSTELAFAMQALIDRVYDGMGQDLSYLSFGTDVDRFLSRSSKSERAALATFIGRSLAYARANPHRSPNTQFGVTFSLPGVLDAPLAETKALLAKSDAVIVTDYPLDVSYRAESPSTAIAALEALADAETRTIVLQELGYPSASEVNSSVEQQRAFYDDVFELLAARRDRFSYVAISMWSDAESALCQSQAPSWGAPTGARLAFALCSLGLKVDASTEKPAWQSALRALSVFARP